MRRSGIASVHISKLIGWRPKTVIQAGIGLNWQEVDCFVEQWPDVQFEGFEPNPLLIKKLEKAEHQYPGNYYPCAIGDKNEEGVLSFRRRHKDGSTLNRLDSREDEPTQKVGVKIRTLDSLFPDYHILTKPILLWLDCEGYELKALCGGKKLIQHVDMVNVEMTGKPNGDGWCKPWEVHRKLIDDGFVLQYIHTFRSSQGQFDAVYVRPNMFKLEYSCSPCRCEDCGG